MEPDNARPPRNMTAALPEGGGADQQHSVLPYPLYHPPAVHGFPHPLPLQTYPLYHQLPLPPLPTYHPHYPPPLYQPAPHTLPLIHHPYHPSLTHHPYHPSLTHHSYQTPPLAIPIHRPGTNRYSQDQLPWLQQLNQSDYEMCEAVMRDVCVEVVESILPDMVREIVSATINDIICSYIGQHWARGPQLTGPSQPHPVTHPLTHPLTLPHTHPPTLPHSHQTERDMSSSPTSDRQSLLFRLHVHEDRYQHILHGKDTTEVCGDVCNLLMEQMLLFHLLTSDLDGGVSMAARAQSPHILTEIVFNELLFKLILQAND